MILRVGETVLAIDERSGQTRLGVLVGIDDEKNLFMVEFADQEIVSVPPGLVMPVKEE